MKTKYDFNFFKKVPWRMAHPDAPKAYDGYYTIVPRKHRFVMNERMQRIQDACERRVHALVKEDSLRRKRRVTPTEIVSHGKTSSAPRGRSA